ncbi:GH25 family lysozyme [Leifsonia sp. NPDC058230]|uniref:GH25 family lysozyme n=1 Tax=Leifsonia sp. NPDC058230 TaxID=3346391 RepID=UPI0036DBC45F
MPPESTTSTRRRRRWWIAGGITGGALLVLGLCAALVATGTVWPNRIFASTYPVRGVDVSTYQGKIDWPTLARQDIDFAFIKATEGSGSTDSRFTANWAAAQKTGLLVGAYHFLSFDSSGETQAQNIIRTVPATAGALPVTVDLEFYGDYFEHPPSRERVRSILNPLLAALEKHYGVPAIIYATPEAFDRYLRSGYPHNPLWIRSVALPPQLPDGRDWAFWQYSNRDRLDGYDGDEQYIDLNVFSGSLQQLETLRQHPAQ